ncbi:MAG: Bug family tripartite tricarboxylate transporter substrate binding protein [Xanthobacteraceae bacterium]
MLSRRTFLAATGGLVVASRAFAQSQVDGWPTKPIRVIFPTGAGGPSELFRMYGEYIKDKIGQPFLYENRPGGSGSIGVMETVRSPADGHTIMVGSNSFTVLNPLVFANSPVNTKRDLAPIALLFSYRFMLVVNPKHGVKTWKEFLDYAKSKPGELNYGSPGIGTGGHLVTELMLKKTGIQAVHVPFQATTQQMLATAGGHLDFTFDTVGNAKSVVDSGKIIALAVSGKGRASAMPDVPSFGEMGIPGFDGLFVSLSALAPAGTRKPIIATLNREIVACQDKPDIKDRLEKGSYDAARLSPEETLKFFDDDHDNWAQVVKETGVRVN